SRNNNPADNPHQVNTNSCPSIFTPSATAVDSQTNLRVFHFNITAREIFQIRQRRTATAKIAQSKFHTCITQPEFYAFYEIPVRLTLFQNQHNAKCSGSGRFGKVGFY
ncbi:hypothetical protein ACFA5Z_002776, partial [Salmonella enterica]